MNILIIGAGETGYYIAQALNEDQNYEVTLIDENSQNLEKAQRSLNVAGVTGNGTSLSVLEQAGIEQADLVIACTDHDETNLICCLLAEQYGVGHKIAVTRTDSFLKRKRVQRYQASGVDLIINSSVVAAKEIVATASLASATEVSIFGERQVMLVGYKIREDNPWKGLALKEIKIDREHPFLFASIVREGDSFIPKGDDVIQEGDYVYLIAAKKHIEEINQALDVKLAQSRRAVIVGGGYIAQRVALGLLHSHYEVTLICDDPLRYHQLKKKYHGKKAFNLVQGDASLVKNQLKMDVATAALFVAVTSNEQYNLLCGLVAKYLGADKTICLANRQDMTGPAEMLDIDVLVSPRLTTARQVKKVVKGDEVDLNYTTLSETDMEVREMIASENSPMIEKPLMELSWPKNTLVGALVGKKNEVIIPTGGTVIHAGDRLIMVTLPDAVPKLKELIEAN